MNENKNVHPFVPGNQTDEALGRATFIVGCLVHEQLISAEMEQIEAAVKLLAAILREFPPIPGDHYNLPFRW